VKSTSSSSKTTLKCVEETFNQAVKGNVQAIECPDKTTDDMGSPISSLGYSTEGDPQSPGPSPPMIKPKQGLYPLTPTKLKYNNWYQKNKDKAVPDTPKPAEYLYSSYSSKSRRNSILTKEKQPI